MEDPIVNGISEVCQCECGGVIRLHTWLFKGDESCRKHYADCTSCSKVSGWHQTADDALAEVKSQNILD